MEQHTKKHARHSFYHLKNALGGLKIAMRGAFLNIKSMLALQIIYSIFYTLIEYSLFQLLLSIALKIDGYSFLNSANIGRFLITPPAIAMLLILFLTACMLTYLNACILLGGFQASLAKQKLRMKDIFLHGCAKGFQRFHFKQLYVALPLFAYQILINLFFFYKICFRINPYSTFLPMLFSKLIYCIPIITFLIFIGIFAVREFFCACYWYLGDFGLKNAKKASVPLVKKNLRAVLSDIVLLNLLVVVLWFILRLLCQIIIVVVVNFFAPADLKVAMVLSFNNTLSIALIWFVTCIGVFLNAAMMTHLFYRFSGNDVILEFHLSYAPDTPLRRIFRACGLVAAGVGVFCFLYYGIYNGALLAERPLSPVQIYCHRGLSSEAPENSLEAIDLAISSLSDGVEIDVQETKDGVVIVCHDSSLKRIAGKKINIADVTYEELKQYDISYYFSKDHEFTYIPTLEEVMSLVKGRAHLLIELKRNSASADLAAKVVGLIEQYEMEYQCSIQSADYAYLRQVNELNPDLTLGYILTTAIGNYYKNDMIDFFCVRSMFVNNTTVAKAHAQGKAVYAWTINTRAEAERMKNAQVDVIITDYPAKAREVIYRDERSSYSIIKLLRLML